MGDSKTHFGFREVNRADKRKLVDEVFSSVANRYDLMNDLMSLGLHRLWKWIATAACGIRPNMRVLDLAGGTADMAIRIKPFMQAKGLLTVADINHAMLLEGQNRLWDLGYADVPFVRCDAENLPFPDHSFDCVVVAFGLRNMSSKHTALRSILRALKPAGRLVVLEFSEPHAWLRRLYHWYSFNVIPKLGDCVTGDEGSYRYLVESIRVHPNQQTLREMIIQSGFTNCEIYNLSGGIVAIHRAYKP